DGGQVDYITWTMAPVIITSYQTGGTSGGDVPVDSATLNYGSIKLEYKMQADTSGTATAVPAFGWDLTKNAPKT
ncbi:MAG: type VI secretion system tube protein Hcp, partial [Candidatus Binataceae bacterium]